MRNIDNSSYDPYGQNNDRRCQCCCGRVFNSYMNAHRRTCYVGTIPDINDFLLAVGDDVNLEMQEIGEESNIRTGYLPKGLIKQGIKLPRSIQQRNVAENYFKSDIDFTSDISNIDNEVTEFQSLIYNCFKDHCGLVKLEYELRYDHLSKSKLKKTLRELKSKEITDIKEIKYISKLRKFKANNIINDCFNHNVKINNNFWNYCRDF